LLKITKFWNIRFEQKKKNTKQPNYNKNKNQTKKKHNLGKNRIKHMVI